MSAPSSSALRLQRRKAVDRAGMDAFTQQFFSDMILESGNPELRELLIARAQGLNACFREELFLDVVRQDTGMR